MKFLLVACNRHKKTAAYMDFESNVIVAIGGKFDGVVHNIYSLGVHQVLIMAIQIDFQAYVDQHGQSPRGVGHWVFVDHSGTEYSFQNCKYSVAVKTVKAQFTSKFDTRFGKLTLVTV